MEEDSCQEPPQSPKDSSAGFRRALKKQIAVQTWSPRLAPATRRMMLLALLPEKSDEKRRRDLAGDGPFRWHCVVLTLHESRVAEWVPVPFMCPGRAMRNHPSEKLCSKEQL